MLAFEVNLEYPYITVSTYLGLFVTDDEVAIFCGGDIISCIIAFSSVGSLPEKLPSAIYLEKVEVKSIASGEALCSALQYLK